MDAATKHRNRHRAIAGLAKTAVVNLAELRAWLDGHGYGEDLPLAGYVNPAASWLWFHDLSQKAAIAWAAKVEPSRVRVLLRQYELATDPEDLAAAKKSLDVAYLSRDLQDGKLLAALHEARLNRLLLGAAYDGELRLYRQYGKTRRVIDFAEAKVEYATNPTARDNIQRIDYWALRQPAPLFGEGFSDEMRQATRLTRHLQLDTWTPTQAALLVCGIDAPAGCNEMPSGAYDLTGAWQSGSWDAFHAARRVLELWHSQMSPPEKVRPAEFVAWCRSKNIKTDWLRDVPQAEAPARLQEVPRSHLQLVESPQSPSVNLPDAGQDPARKLLEQEKAIIEWLKANDYNPKNLPPTPNGHPTAKAFAKAALNGKDVFMAKTAFDKAWNRLREDKEIMGGTGKE